MAFLETALPARSPWGPSLRASGLRSCFGLEYCLMAPANRIGYGRFSLLQLKVIQEVVTLLVFAVFTVVWMRGAPAPESFLGWVLPGRGGVLHLQELGPRWIRPRFRAMMAASVRSLAWSLRSRLFT